MDQNSHSSSSARSSFIDDLHKALLGVDENISQLEQAVLGELPTFGGEHKEEKARLYFHLYTIPLLEAAGLFESGRRQEQVFWGAVQSCMGLHIRYADYIIDNDRTGLSTPLLTKRAHAYLARAQSLLLGEGHSWGCEQIAIYGQYIDYECEVEQGYFHDLSSLWRRVSPLCVVGETYLASSIRAPEFRRSYRDFLGWSLIHADCDDVLEDLSAQRKTPVTHLIGERITGSAPDLFAAAEAMARIKEFQAKQAQRLLESIGDDCPAWRTIIKEMDKVFR